MSKTRKILCVLAAMALCPLLLGGCSGDREKKEEKKTLSVQEQQGRDAAQALQKPMNEARNAAAKASADADRALKEVEGAKKPAQDAGVAPNPTGGKEKKKLEGC